jgi:hypothetical protein
MAHLPSLNFRLALRISLLDRFIKDYTMLAQFACWLPTLEADVSGGASDGDAVIDTLSSAGGSQYLRTILRTMVETTTEHLQPTTVLLLKHLNYLKIL